jgi:hypothetical protein
MAKAKAKKATKKAAPKKAAAKKAPKKAAKKTAKKAAKKSASKKARATKKTDDAGGEDPKKKKKKAKRKSKKEAEVLRLRVFWGVFNHAMKRVALYDFNQRKAAEKRAKELSPEGKPPHFVQKVKEEISDKTPEEIEAAAKKANAKKRKGSSSKKS